MKLGNFIDSAASGFESKAFQRARLPGIPAEELVRLCRVEAVAR